ncbi:Amidohydrolase-like protein [Ceratobasidium theobromae]|uniref:Amidohydrolase-like protein n=1 Tax=Ceratobasidium theobromae TaxID=1582974 RepID=A0A5N5QLN0_9AGAM|nr:Amidohydrolase-like protein [Ceratobasidium theobromae]
MTSGILYPEAMDVGDLLIDELSLPLRELSLEIHENPGLGWDVGHAHDVLTQFLEERGFTVTRHYLADQLPGNTAWRGEFVLPAKTGEPLRVVGFNSEMDALPGIGHACGHNLIAIAGVAAALGLRAAMKKHEIPGKIVILGTPAEEKGMGKEWLLRAGAYKEMDICLMAHPGPGNDRGTSTPRSLAAQSFIVEYKGQTRVHAHAGATPWEGRNALDAAFVAYSALSALRQQMHPSLRLHGIIEGQDWTQNVIPGSAKMTYGIRAPTWEEAVTLRARVNKCFEAGALATSCSISISEEDAMKDLRQNTVLSDEFASIIENRHNYSFKPNDTIGASTDFGNVTSGMNGLIILAVITTFVTSPVQISVEKAITPNGSGGNHTREFTEAARTQEAHERTLVVSKGLATVGLRALLDESFLQSVCETAQQSKLGSSKLADRTSEANELCQSTPPLTYETGAEMLVSIDELAKLGFLSATFRLSGSDLPLPYPNKFKSPTMTSNIPYPEAMDAGDLLIDELSLPLRELCLEIHENPELGWDVRHAHNALTQFLEDHGFTVTRHYLADQLPGNTAWRGEFTLPAKTGEPLRVVGFNSEMDALPGIGHACGHNLIAIAGVAAALGLRAAMKKHEIPGKIVILGTPDEEKGMGKEWLLRAGAYKEMDVCLMVHPGPGDDRGTSIPRSLALQSLTVEYGGQTLRSAHAGASPWEGKNALDAAFVAYSALSALRQQMHPSLRLHGIIEGQDWSTNVIPGNAKMTYDIRAPTWEEVVTLRARVDKCFEAGALATSCSVSISEGDSLKDLRQNNVLADEFGVIMNHRHNHLFNPNDPLGASTDFGNVTFALPSLHPRYAIPVNGGGSNHTLEFTEATRTQEAHERTLAVSKGLATVGLRILLDNAFLQSVSMSAPS